MNPKYVPMIVIPLLLAGCVTKKPVLTSKGKQPLSEEDLPTLKAPEANCTRIGERIEGNKYYGPQVVCTIERPAIWTH